MSRKGENIYKRKDGRWEGRILIPKTWDGKRHYSYFYGKSYSEVKKRMNQAKFEHFAVSNSAGNRVRISTIAQLWIEHIQSNVKESTYSRYSYLLQAHIIPEIGNNWLDTFSTQTIEQYVGHLLQDGRVDHSGGLSPKTVSDILAITKSIMRFANKAGYETCCDFRLITVKKKTLNSIKIISPSDQEKLKTYLVMDTDETKLGVLLSLFTGLRLGEVCALKWGNINLEERRLEVRYTVQRIQNTNKNAASKTRVIISTPKSDCAVRDIPLPAVIAELAQTLQKEPECFVLSGSKNEIVEPRALQYKFKRIIAHAKISPVNFHSLRHTFATRCIENGFEIKCLSEILGHANVNITLDRYVHPSFQAKKRNMDKLFDEQ